ncbi:4Fe-4S dicluster domain-containing protein [Desulfonema limicola]|uniref:4Fe-4S dicluster domain-containing protein n=1 Tax=Desulfonema limicola TaxID=45656 RepID=A0A975GH45_9BACT|nr:4Fe-4S dicluster domain-containing protein [Desulfonema limicola]QTA80863.1 4Fe-4S dicluster domain-containing protein [Desulfonema limicola]
MTASVLEFSPENTRPFLQEVMEQSGQMLTACYQCRKCAAGCTVGDETGSFTPNILIRAIVLGDRETALNNELIWKCVSCYTCGTRCPNDIQTARITETLKKMAKKAHVQPVLPKVAAFHDAFVESGMRWGRLNEMEFMGVYELKNALREAKTKNYETVVKEFKTQAELGLAMLKLKRLHFGFLFSKGRGEIKALYRKNRYKQALKAKRG